MRRLQCKAFSLVAQLWTADDDGFQLVDFVLIDFISPAAFLMAGFESYRADMP